MCARLLPLFLFVCFAGCSSIGHTFRSDAATLSMLVVGETTPEDAIQLLGADPYIRQNLPNGTLAWHWQHIQAGAYVGITDNRSMVLLFEASEDGAGWRFSSVMSATNIDLPPGMPFGFVVNSDTDAPAPTRSPVRRRMIGVFFERSTPAGDFLPEVTRLVIGGRAEAAGWEVGDYVVSVDGVAVRTVSDMILETQRGGSLKLYVLRRKEREIESTIDFRNEES